MPISWKPEVFVEGKWSQNQLAFATEVEAKNNAYNLMCRWTLVEDCRASESEQPVNYRWDDMLGLQRVAPIAPPSPELVAEVAAANATRVVES